MCKKNPSAAISDLGSEFRMPPSPYNYRHYKIIFSLALLLILSVAGNEATERRASKDFIE